MVTNVATSCPGCGRALEPEASRSQGCEGCGLPRVVLGEYRLEQRLGQGGMASVYGARRERDGAAVAVKLMRVVDQEDWKGRELFERSSKVLRGLEHPQLPRVFGFGELDDGSLVLVRERFDGGTLESWVAEEHWRGSPAEIRALLESLLGVLEVLHGLVPPVIHRDIKPSNVMFRHGPDRPIARNPAVLVDFDTVATASGQGQTIVVSPGYTAPEQLAGKSSAAADLYSLGMTMLRVITHQEPDALERDDDGRVVLGAALDGLDRGCRRIVGMLIEPDRGDRPSSARWALEQLRGATEDASIPRAAPWRPTWLTDHRLGLGAAVLIGSIAVALIPSEEPRPPTPVDHAPRTADRSSPELAAASAPPVAAPLRCRGSEADCNGERDDGCETDLHTSPAHCGRCGQACGPEQRCVAGECSEAVIAIASSLYGHCEQRHGGALWCGDDDASLLPVELPHPVVSFDADRHRCAVTDDGALYCWGDNGLGQAGTGTGRRLEPEPVRLEGLEGVTEVSLGRHTGCAVAEGQAHCWGSSLSFGVIGSPKNYGTKTPIRVRRMNHVERIRSGPMHVCVIRQSAVWCWGDGRGGATGDPARPQGSAPTKIEGLSDATDLALGRDHTCALRSSGSVACWGTNTEGQLGDGSAEDSFTPVELPLSGVVELASENVHTCARTEEGDVLCWGGSGARVPTKISLPTRARFITMSGDRLIAILEDGQLVEQRLDDPARLRRNRAR